MSLEQAIIEVKERIAKLGPRERISEADTKSSLINPILIALGWHIGNLDEVREEYSMPGGSRADYALLENGKPVIIVEAKAYGCTLDEKSRIQYINYAQSAAIPLAVLTNGDDWEFHYATEGKIEARKRTIGEIRFSSNPCETISNMLRVCSFDKSMRDKLLENRIISIWLPFVRDALISAVNSRTSRIIKLLRSEDTDILPDNNDLIRDCLLYIAHQVSNNAEHMFPADEEIIPADKPKVAIASENRGSKLDKKFKKLPGSLYNFTQKVRQLLREYGLEERAYDYYTYHSRKGECIAISKRIRNQQVMIYPIRTHFDNWSGLPSKFKILLGPYKQNWFRTEKEIIISSGQEALGMQFIDYFLKNLKV
ncbi:type I restriction enzyme HsdR N-terminal domain-containing protein [bacterium]|nr:type I restriction enzyme HsdR N-terminal domain-containing protein [bacterium]